MKMTKTLKTFYTLLVTQTLSLIGSRMTTIGVGLWVFNKTGQATPLLLTAFFNELPGMLFGSLAGVLVDRWDRRIVMILADSGQAVGSLVLLVSFLSGGFQVWHLYLIAFWQGLFATFQGPAENAATTMLVQESHRDRANAIKEMAFPLAGVIAPVLSGLIYSFSGIGGVIAVDLTTFGVAVLVALFVHIPHPPASTESLATNGTILREMLAAFRYLGQRRSLLYFIFYMSFINFMLNGPLDLTLPYMISMTGSERITGTIMGVMSLGAFAGAGLITIWSGTRPRMKMLLASMLFNGIMFLFFGILRSPFGVGLALFLLMIPLPMMNTLYMSILQVKTPPDMQGRIFAFQSQLGLLGSTLSFVLTGPLIDKIVNPSISKPAWSRLAPFLGSGPEAGIGLVLVITGIIIFAVTLLVAAITSIRQLETRLPDYEPILANRID
jgi:MFS family permease